MAVREDARSARRRNPRGQGELLRAELVAAASRLLETVQSEEALSLRAVAREAGVAAPSVYLHFADKTELMWAVLEERFDELRSAIEHAATGSGDPAEELRSQALAYCAFAAANPGSYRVLFNAVSSQKPSLALADLPGSDVFLALVESVRRCMVAGVLRPADPFLAGTALWASLHGLAMLRISKPSFPWPPVDAVVDHLLATHEVSAREPGGTT